MATTTSFKQQCPSCEAMVPVRDPKLIGKKIDCPKCKYRFVVENPGEDEDQDLDEAPSRKGSGSKRPLNGKARRDDDDDRKPAKKKKEGSSTTLILGIGLGAVALILLAVGGYFLFSGSDSKPSAKAGGGGGSTTTPNKDKQDEKDPLPPQVFGDVRNLLPNEVDAVRTIAVDQFAQSTAGKAAFGTPGTFNADRFKQKFGLALGEIKTLVTGYNHRQNWIFNVVRTAVPVKRETFINLLLKPAKPVDGLTYDMVGADLDSFGFAFLSGSKARPLGLYIMPDEHTFVLADVLPMEQFLLAKGQPIFQSQPPTATDQPPVEEKPPQDSNPSKGFPGGPQRPGFGNAGGSSPPPGVGGPPRPGFGPPDGAPGFPGGPNAGGTGTPAPAPQPASTISGSYLTIDKYLKSMLDKLEDAKQSPLVCLAVNLQFAPNFVAKNANQMPLLRVFKALEEKWKDASYFGAALGGLRTDKVEVTIGIDCKDDQRAHELQKEAYDALAKRLESDFKDKFETELGVAVPTSPSAQPGRGNFGGGAFGQTGGPPGFGASGSAPPGFGKFGGGPPGLPGGGPGGISPRPPGGGGEIGGSVSPIPGSGPPPGFGAGGSGRGFPGFPGFPGAPGQTTQEKKDPPASTFTVQLKDKTVVLAFDLVFKKGKEKSFDLLFLEAQGDLVELKGRTDMVDGRTRIHDLARAVQGYADKAKAFPRGTVDRRPSANRSDIPYPPTERLSFFAELLPFISQGEYAGLVDEIVAQESWTKISLGNEDRCKNLLVAKTLIPCFLAPNTPEATWWVKYPGVAQPVASTHFVGVAGLGLDAANYPANDPTLRKKLGVFGYDRATTLAEITDGLEQTIVLIQVPPLYKTPWLAGGGSTVRGISEADGVAPFVCTEYKGKPGTFAIMADGAVRFLSKDFPNDKFKALVTIAGDDKIDKAELDVLCPIVPSEDASLKTATAPEVKAPVIEEPKKEEPKQDAGTSDVWKEFSPPGSSISVHLPGVPTEVPNTGSGHTYSLEKNSGAFAFVLGVSPITKEALAQGPEKILDASRDALLKAYPGAKIAKEEKVSFEGNSGKEITIDATIGNEMGRLIFRIYVIKDQMIQLAATGSNEKFDEKAKTRFFDSLALKK